MNQAAVNLLTTPLPIARMEQELSQLPLRVLTAAMARGDDAAWTEFHRVHGPEIFRRLLAATRGDHDLASEALQQSYLRLARHVRECDSEAMFAGWLRVVARSTLHDCWRRRRSFWQMLQRSHADPTATDFSAAKEHRLLEQLDTALATLEPDDRALLEAKYFSGTDVRTLAEKLMISPKAAESRLTRARAELRRRMIAALSHHE
ncbi:MAG TPA: sigma-70 family RNA polymerase sigma factor [Opitutaceae bacterium]|nr:sigma-70 family RNA polymerase sigma factor [Opitutaceae bacterium]